VVVAVSRACQACSQRQWVGRWSRSCRAARASRAGMLTSWVRMVAVVALAWNIDARQPAARVRLCAIAAQTSHAAFAVNDPDGRCANGPVLRSAITCSTIVAAVTGLGLQHDQVAVGEHGVVPVGG